MAKAPSYGDAVKRFILPDKTIAEYPDSTSDEVIQRDLAKYYPQTWGEENTIPQPNESMQQNIPSQQKTDELFKNQLKNVIGINSTPFGNLRDAIYGFGKAGEGIARTFAGENAPSMPNIGQANQNPLAVALGQYAPFAIAGGPGLVGSTLGALGFGATQYEPGQRGVIDTALNKIGVPYPGNNITGRIRNAVEDSLLNMVFHGLAGPFGKLLPKEQETIPTINFKNNATFTPKTNEIGKVEAQVPSFLTEKEPAPLSQNIADELTTNLMGNRNLEQSGKELASHINKSYTNVKDIHSQKFNTIFDSPTGEISYQTGEPLIVKDQLMLKSNYLKHDPLAETKDKNLQLLDSQYRNNSSIANAHNLQAELGSEIGYLKRQRENNLLDAEGKNRLKTYIEAQNTLQEDIRSALHDINPELRTEYDLAREDWLKNVIPYHTDKELREIAEGRVKNPVSGSLTNIFRNPEENINKVISDLPPESKDRLVQIAMGQMKEDLTPEKLLAARRSLETNGMSSYVNPQHEQNFRALRSNIQLENERKLQSEVNRKFTEGLKNIQAQSEKQRLSAAATRETGFQAAQKESNKTVENFQKKFNTEYEKGLKEGMKIQKAKKDFFKKLFWGSAAIAAERTLGLNQADLLAGYLGAYYKGNKLEKAMKPFGKKK